MNFGHFMVHAWVSRANMQKHIICWLIICGGKEGGGGGGKVCLSSAKHSINNAVTTAENGGKETLVSQIESITKRGKQQLEEKK